MADLLTYTYPSGVKEFVPIAKTNAAEHNSVFRGEELPYSWAELKTKITNGDFSNLYIGDYKQITLTTNEVVVCEIAGINNYKGWGSTAIGNHIDFISRDCLATAYKFNTTNTNNGYSGNTNPFGASALYQTLNNSTDGVKTTLSSDLLSVIIPKYAYVESRYSSGGVVSSDTNAGWTNIGYLWTPSEVEVYGHASWSEIGYGTAGFMQYPIFRLNPTKIVKCAGQGGTRGGWWNMSVHKNSSSYVCYVGDDGHSGFNSANTTYRVPLCFRIA